MFDNLRIAGRIASSIAGRKVSYLILFVTARCNMLCKHCFYTDEIQAADALGELSLPEYEALARSTGKLTNLNITGGEPFIREDLAQIAGLFREHTGVPFTGITTNGLLCERILETTEKICAQKGPYHLKLGVSLDGLEAQHDEMRRPGSFARAVETIKALDSLRKKFPSLFVYVSTTLTKYNKGAIQDLIDFVRELPVDAHYMGLARGKTMQADAKDVGAAEYAAAAKHLKRRWNTKNHFYNLLNAANALAASVNREILETKRCVMPCVAGEKMLVVAENGEVKPCEMLEYLGKPHALGNLRDFGFDLRRMLESAGSREIRRRIVEDKCFCTFENAAQASVVYKPANLLTAASVYWKQR